MQKYKLEIRAVKTSNTPEQQMYKVDEEQSEVKEAFSYSSDIVRITEELCDLIQACFTMLAMYGDIEDIWGKHLDKMDSRGWMERI